MLLLIGFPSPGGGKVTSRPPGIFHDALWLEHLPAHQFRGGRFLLTSMCFAQHPFRQALFGGASRASRLAWKSVPGGRNLLRLARAQASRTRRFLPPEGGVHRGGAF